MVPSSIIPIPNSGVSVQSQISSSSTTLATKTHLTSLHNSKITSGQIDDNRPTMSDIINASKAQNLELRLQTLGPFFRITATSMDTKRELGRAEGLIRVWYGGRILHLDSIRLSRETLGMDRSIFGIGLFIGAVAIRYGYDCGCKIAQLLAINDSDLYHSKLVRFYTRIGFRAVHEVTGSSMGDLAHMLVWGGKGTRMDADVEELLLKWCSRFKSKH